jgi:autotransporter-associated beta strand protein
MQIFKNKFSTDFPTARVFFPCLLLMLAAGGVAVGQTVVDVDRNRFESARAIITGTHAINVHDGVTYTLQNSSWLGDTSGGGVFYVNGGVFTLGPVDGGTGRTVFTGNIARRGGAVVITGGAIATLTNVRFGTLTNVNSGNRTIGDHGGAISLIADNTRLTLLNAEFYRNVSERGTPPGGLSVGGGFGGAIYIPNNGVLVVRDSTFGSLSQPDPVDFFSAGWSAPVYGSVGADRGSGNWAIDGRGGAIGTQGAGLVTRISVYNSSFYHNTAARGLINNAGDGGAISLGDGSQQLYVEDSLFYGNRSRGGYGGGALFLNNSTMLATLRDTVFTNNYATGAGGAIFLSGGTLNLAATKDLTYEGNYVAMGVTSSAPRGSGGGFLYMGAAIANINIATGATLTIGGAANDDAYDNFASSVTNAVINVNSAATATTAGGDADTGTLILHAASTDYGGALNIHAGSVLLGGTAARFGGTTSQITVRTGGTFGGVGIARNVTVESGGVLQVGAAGIEGADELYTFMDVVGTLRLADGATITGHGYIGTAVDVINSDTVARPNAIVLGAAAGDWVTARVGAGDTLSIVGSGTFSGTVSGAGGLVKTGAGLLYLARAGSYTGGTRLEEGALLIANERVLGAGTLSVTGANTGLIFEAGMDFANAIDIAGAGSVTLTTLGGDVAMQSAITGAGVLAKTGAGELMLYNNAAAFTGAVVIGQGVLSGDINAASAVLLDGDASATYAGNLSRSSGQLLAGSGSISGNLALSDARLSFDLHDSASGGAAQIRVSGSVTSAGNNLINLDNVGTATRYTLFHASAFDMPGADPNDYFTVATVNGEALTNRYDPLFSTGVGASGPTIGVNPGVRNLRVTWTGGASDAGAPAAWNTQAGNWSEASGERYFRDGDSVIFGAASSGAVAIDAAGVIVGDLSVETAAGRSLSFTGGGITGANTSTDSDRHNGSADGLVYLDGGSTDAVTGKLVKTGGGTLVFANDVNDFAGGIEIRSGAIAFNDGGQLGGAGIAFTDDAALRADASTALAAAVSVAAGKTATFDTRENALDYTGALTSEATSTIAKTGSGDLWINTVSQAAHHGATEVHEGRVLLAGNAGFGDGAVTVLAGAGFGGHGAAQNVTVLDGGALHAGTPDALVAEQLTVSSALTLNAGASVSFSIISGNADPLASVNSSLMAGGVALTGGGAGDITIDLDRLVNGVYNLGDVSALTGATITYFGQELGERQKITYESTAASGTLLIKINMPDNQVMQWTGATNGNWNINTGNWQIANSGTAYSFGDGDKLIFDGVADAAHADNRVITIAGRRMTLSDMEVTGTADYVFRGDARIITDANSATPNISVSAQGKLLKEGEGTLSFENAGNEFTGGIEIKGGAVSFTKAEQLGTGAGGAGGAGIVLDSGTLRAAGELIVLSETIAIAAGKSGAFDTATHTVRYTGAFAPGASGTSGTFVKTGFGVLELMSDNSAYDGSLLVSGGELLLRNNAMTLTRLGGTVRVADGGTFGGEGEIAGAVTVGQGGTLRIGVTLTGDGRLSAADLRMENGSAIHGAGILSGSLTIGTAAGDLVTLTTAAGSPVTITATTGGDGTLVKAGGGLLTLSGAAPLGHAQTRIEGGLVYVRDIDPLGISSIVHSFDLAGGWLDLADVRDFGDVPYDQWTGLTLTGSAGGVIGYGDEIKLRDGDTGFQIGGSGTGRGVFVVVDAGAGGTSTLSGSSNYVGYTRVDSGVLAVSQDVNLGNTDANIAAPRDVILNGGSLLAADGFASGRRIELRQAGAVIVAGGTASWLALSGTGDFTKEGAGTLFLTLPSGETNAHTGAKTVAAGVLQGRAGTLTGLITSSGTVALYAAEDDYPSGVFTGTIHGGAFAKTGDGSADIGNTAVFNGLDSVRVEDGILTSTGRPLTIAAAVSVDIGDRGIFNFPKGGAVTAPVLRNQGMIRVGLAAGGNVPAEKLTINGDYHGGASADAPGYLTLGIGNVVEGRVIEADTLHITGSASGKTHVSFVRLTGNDPFGDNLAAQAGSLPSDVIRVDGGGGEFLQSGRLTYGVKDYVLAYEPETGTSRWRISTASEIPALVAVDAALMIANHASLGGLSQRLESMGLLDGYKGRQGFDFWANGIYRHDKFSDTIYSGATAETYGWQAGVDYTDANRTFALGIFVEKISSDTDMPYATDTTSDTDGFGAYITYRPSMWFLNLLIRLGQGRYDVNIPDTPTFGTDTGSAGLSAEVGRYYNLGKGWLLEPQVQFLWSRSNVDNTKDNVPVAGIDDPRTNFGREYRVKAIEYSLLRASLMVSRNLVIRRTWELRPYARASFANEFGGNTDMTVYTIGETIKYKNSLGGAYGTLNGGATLRIRDRFDLWTDLAWYYAGKIDGYSINVGAGWRF